MEPKEKDMHTVAASYFLVKQGLSDIEFYNDEIQFFRNLIDKYILLMVDQDNFSQVQEIGRQLLKIEKQKDDLKAVTLEFMSLLEHELKSPAAGDEEGIVETCNALQLKTTELSKTLRAFKKDLFAITEHLLNDEKLQHLLNRPAEDEPGTQHN